MLNINQTGTFRGDVIDRGLGQSSGGYPQLIVQLRATEKYDEQNEVWVPWDYEEVDATAYLVLFGKDNKPLLNVKQCMKAFGWDGASFQSLQENQTKQIQFRMAASTYEGVERIKCEWVDSYDADPMRKVAKLDVSDVKKLDAQYAAALKASGGGPKPKSARPTAPVASPTPDSPAYVPAPTGTSATVSPDPTPTPTTSPSAEPAPKRGRGRPKAPATPPPSVTVPSAVPSSSTAMTQQEAWDAYSNLAQKSGKHTELVISSTWTGIVGGLMAQRKAELGRDVGEVEAVGADWIGVYAECCRQLGV